MFKLGFTMEELLFPENSQSYYFFNMVESNCSFDRFDMISSRHNCQQQIIFDDGIDDDNDDWFTIKELNSVEINLNRKFLKLSNDQTLPILDNSVDHHFLNQTKSMMELDGKSTELSLSNISVQSASRTKCPLPLLTSDTNSFVSFPTTLDHGLLTTTTIVDRPQSNTDATSKSTSSLSFCTQSSASLLSVSTDEMSSNSNDISEYAALQQTTEYIKQISHHRKDLPGTNDNMSNVNNKRRRKRTIFSTADIEHLKEAFTQNPKPNQQDIAILSEQLGHDSYVIRVWFYNKRQATKKRTG